MALDSKQALLARLTGGFEGKTAIVTGGTRGIGFAIAEDLAALGVTVLICSRTEKDVDAAASGLRKKGLNVQGAAVDISTPEGRTALLEKAKAISSKLDILVNNAGILGGGPTESFPLEQHQQIIRINQEAVFALTQAAHPLLKAAASGTIIMISSIGGGPLAVESCASYAMSKGAMDHFTRYLACEWARDGITCNCVKPGYTETEMIAEFLASEEGQGALSRTPLKRVGQVADISGLVVFLASPSARFTTGQLISVDGGLSVYGYWQSR